MMKKRLLPLATALLAASPLTVLAEARVYGQANVSIDYLDVDPSSGWARPAIGGPAYDVLSFIDEANQILHDAGYEAALPPPRDLDTVVGDSSMAPSPSTAWSPPFNSRFWLPSTRPSCRGKPFVAGTSMPPIAAAVSASGARRH